MKKVIAALVLGLSVIGSAYATNGYIYCANVNHVFKLENKVQFKIVAKNSDGIEVKTIESDDLMPKRVISYKLSDFGLDQGFLDVYVRDNEKKQDYNKCLEGFPYDYGLTVIIHGWDVNQGATCAYVEDDVSHKGK